MFGSRKRKNKLTFIVKSDDQNTNHTNHKTNNNHKNKILTVFSRKGKKKTFDTDNAEKIINNLAKNPNHEIKTLTGDLKEDFSQLVRYVELLYGHEYYDILLDLIRNNFHFKGQIKPFTIAAYMTGCKINTNLDNNSCSTLCSGNIKYPNEKGETDFCDHPVVSAKYNKIKSIFTFLCTEGDDSKDRIAFVNVEYTTLRSFPGFNDAEKNWLRQKGFERIYLYGSTNHKTYINLTPDSNGDPIPIDDIKPRIGKNKYIPADYNMNNYAIIGIAILIVIVLIFFFYIYYQSKQNKYKSERYHVYDR